MSNIKQDTILIADQRKLDLQKFKAIIDSSDDAIINKTLNGTIQSWNKGAESIFGYTASEVIGKPMLILIPKDRVDEEPEILSRIARGERVEHFETVRVHKDGTLIDISATISPIYDAQDRIVGASKIARDISSQKKIEMELKDSESIFKAIINNLSVNIALLDSHGTIKRVNQAWRDFAISNGASAEDVSEGINYLEVCDKVSTDCDNKACVASAKEVASTIRAIISGKLQEYNFEYECSPPGLFRYYKTRIVKCIVGNELHVVVIHDDITGLKEAEEKIRQRERDLKSILDNTPALIGYWDRELHCRFGNQAYYEWFGVEPKNMPGMHIREVIGEERYAQNLPHIDGALRGEPQLFERIFSVPGSTESRSSQTSYIPDIQHGEIIGFYVLVTDITKIKLAEQRLLKALTLQSAIMNNTTYSIITTRPDGLITSFNPAAERMLGYTADEMINKQTTAFIHDPTEVAARAHDFSSELGEMITPGFEVFVTKARRNLPNEYEWSYLRKDGTRFPVLLSVTALRDEHGEIFGFVGIAQDITERKKADEQLRLTSVTFETHEVIVITDVKANIIRVNRAFERITGYKEEEVLGRNPRILQSGRQDKTFYVEMWRTLLSIGIWSGELWDRAKNGNIYPKFLTISAVKNAFGETTQYVGIFNDITERKKAEEEIHNLAFNDALTGLPNRRLLLDRLSFALSVSARSKIYGALLYMDMDRFKTLNNTLGHEYGDLLLKEIASRLKLCVREVDALARLGGDEFVVLIENVGTDSEAALKNVAQFAEKIRSVIATPYRLKETTYHSSPSIGVCLFYGNEVPMDELIKRADMAMYQAKESGRNKVRFFDPHMQQSVETRAALEADLRVAIADRQFRLFYQIQLDNENRAVGAEALIRWIHPKRGMVPPLQFITIAEESSLIIEIGQWVLDTACQQISAWSNNEQTRNLVLAVNISAQQFKQPGFVEQVKGIIRKYNIEPSKIKIELTESVALDNIDAVVKKMLMLKEVGVTLSLDDFGTGYSSLAYLKRLPIDQIKIDQSFVRDITTDADDAVMVKTIISMAQNFGLHVIAEGVETEAQHTFLKKNGCMAYQGYLFSRPLPIEKFEALLK